MVRKLPAPKTPLIVRLDLRQRQRTLWCSATAVQGSLQDIDIIKCYAHECRVWDCMRLLHHGAHAPCKDAKSYRVWHCHYHNMHVTLTLDSNQLGIAWGCNDGSLFDSGLEFDSNHHFVFRARACHAGILCHLMIFPPMQTTSYHGPWYLSLLALSLFCHMCTLQCSEWGPDRRPCRGNVWYPLYSIRPHWFVVAAAFSSCHPFVPAVIVLSMIRYW